MGSTKKINITEIKYGNWTVLKDLGTRVQGTYKISNLSYPKYVRYYLVACICGYEKEITASSLKSGLSKGCQFCHCRSIQKHTKHNLCNIPEYKVWSSLVNRCLNPNNQAYDNYGGRGIKVCSRWLDKKKGFTNFISDMGKRPNSKYSIDRINNDGNYEPDNCRWATIKQQNNNKRNKAA